MTAVHIQIAVDKAGLLARAKALKEKHGIEMDKVKLQARMEALKLKEDLAISNAKSKVLEEFEPSLERQPAYEPEDDMNAYLEGYLERHTTEPVEAKSMKSSRIDSVLSPPHFAELGAVPKTPLQAALRAHQMSTTPQQPTTAAVPKTQLGPSRIT